MNLGNDYVSAKAFEEFVCKGYICKIVNVETTTSKSSGKPMVVFSLDISRGAHAGKWSEYPKKIYVTYGDSKGLGKLKSAFDAILKFVNDDGQTNLQKSFNGIDPTASGCFDETAFIGLECGVVMKYNDKGYIEPKYITTREKAESAQVVNKPAPKSLVEDFFGTTGDFIQTGSAVVNKSFEEDIPF